MPPRTPYDIVAIEANKILNKMLTSNDIDSMKKYHDQYLAYLEANNWTDWDYDAATLERVNKDWDPPSSKPMPAHKTKPRQHSLN